MRRLWTGGTAGTALGMDADPAARLSNLKTIAEVSAAGRIQ
jgi:hypothetical protein